MSDGIGLVLNSWLSNLYRTARGRKRLSSLPIATSSVVAAEQEITGMKVTEVRTARSCASWLSHYYRSRANGGRFCLPLRSSLFSGESPRNFLILPPIQRSKNFGPAPSLQLRVIRQPYTLHHPARGGSSLMPSSHTDPEICARHNLGSSRPARRLPQCTLRRNLRSTAQPQKTKTLRASKALGLRL